MPSRSIIWLIAANLLPVAGVLFWDWHIFSLLFLFWCENVVIGIFGIARMMMSSEAGFGANVFQGLFFTVHYGGFMFGHLFFLTAMFLNDSFTTRSGNPFNNFLSLFDRWTITALIALAVSHGWSFFENFVGKKEYSSLTPAAAMSLPYKRMMITHVALIAGGFLLTRLDEPTVGLLVLLLMKIALDVIFHRREHDKL